MTLRAWKWFSSCEGVFVGVSSSFCGVTGQLFFFLPLHLAFQAVTVSSRYGSALQVARIQKQNEQCEA